MTIFNRFFVSCSLLLLLGCGATISIFSTNKTTNLGLKIALRRGVIFTDKYVITDPEIIDYNPTTRFTPTRNDMENVQGISRILGAHGRPNDPNYRPPVVGENWNAYFMQCVGFINSKGDRIVHVNYHWNKFDSKLQQFNYEDDYVSIHNNPHDYQADFNLTKQLVENLKMNKSD